MPEMPVTAGVHHVTAMASDPGRNLRFYGEVLGQRLVKRTVNYDDPGTHHLYYGDHLGAPGTILTFFPWPRAKHGAVGTGQPSAVAYAVPAGTLGAWSQRLNARGLAPGRGAWPGGERLRFDDPDGLRLELVERTTPAGTQAPRAGTLPAREAPDGIAHVTLRLADPEPTTALLRAMGFEVVSEEPMPDGGGLCRRLDTGSGAPGSTVELEALGRDDPGRFGPGSIHHVAFRVPDDGAQAAAREALLERGLQVTPVRDRQYFRSIYTREPGGVLFEFATDGPGFATDESPDALGTALRLPPWLEPRREELEARLPPLPRGPSDAT